MAYEVKSKPYWGLNLLIVVLAAILVAVLLIPQKIWNEEEQYREMARQNMQNFWKVEDTFYDLTGRYTEYGNHAIQIVNMVYDSAKQGVEWEEERTVSIPADSVSLNVDRQAIAHLMDSTLADTVWTAYREKLLAFYNDMTEDSTHSGQHAYNILRAAYDSLQADTAWTGTRTIIYPHQYEVELPPNYVRRYDTTFVETERIKKTVQDTMYMVVTQSESDSIVTYDTTRTAKQQLSDMRFRYPDLQIIDSSITVDDRWITQTRKTRPTTSWLYDPLTGKPYNLEVTANGLHLRIESPIQGEYTERRYYVFTFSDTSHGFIEDGDPSWDENQ